MLIWGLIEFLVGAVAPAVLTVEYIAGFPFNNFPSNYTNGLAWDPLSERLLTVNEDYRVYSITPEGVFSGQLGTLSPVIAHVEYEVTHIAFNDSNDTLYGLGDARRLFTIDMDSWVVSEVNGVGNGAIHGSAVGGEGLYGITFFNGDLYTVNGAEFVWKIDPSAPSFTGGTYGSRGEISVEGIDNYVYGITHDGNYLYTIDDDDDGPHLLIRVDPTVTGTVDTIVAELPQNIVGGLEPHNGNMASDGTIIYFTIEGENGIALFKITGFTG